MQEYKPVSYFLNSAVIHDLIVLTCINNAAVHKTRALMTALVYLKLICRVGPLVFWF